MKNRNFKLFLVGSILAGPLLAVAASFDCTKAGTEIEKSICASEVLSKLDDELGSSYRSAKSSSVSPEKLQAEQRSWIRERNACKDNECLKNSYELRIDQLRKADSSLNKPTANVEISTTETHVTQAPVPVIEKPSAEASVKTAPPAPLTVVENSTPAPSAKPDGGPKENKNSSDTNDKNDKNGGVSIFSIFIVLLKIVTFGFLIYALYASYKAIRKQGNWRTPILSLFAFMLMGSIGQKITGDSSEKEIPPEQNKVTDVQHKANKTISSKWAETLVTRSIVDNKQSRKAGMITFDHIIECTPKKSDTRFRCSGEYKNQFMGSTSEVTGTWEVYPDEDGDWAVRLSSN